MHAQTAPRDDDSERAEEARRRARRDVPTIATGGAIWLAGYLASIATAAGLWIDAGTDPHDLHRDLLGASFIPVAGPWVQLGVDVDDGRRAYWAALGVAQLAGIVLVGIGHFIGHPDGPPVALVPLDGGAAIWSGGTF